MLLSQVPDTADGDNGSANGVQVGEVKPVPFAGNGIRGVELTDLEVVAKNTVVGRTRWIGFFYHVYLGSLGQDDSEMEIFDEHIVIDVVYQSHVQHEMIVLAVKVFV